MRAHFVLLALSMIVPATIAHQAPEECIRFKELFDPEEDQVALPSGEDPLVRDPSVDLLWYRMSETDRTLRFEFQVAEAPQESAPSQMFRYWLGFFLRLEDGSEFHMDTRLSSTMDYRFGNVMGPEDYGLPFLEEVELEWTDDSASFTVSKAPIETMVGGGAIEYVLPSASSDGPHPLTLLQGPNDSPTYQVDHINEVYPTPHIPCTAEPSSDGTIQTNESERPGLGLLLMGGLAGAVITLLLVLPPAWFMVRRSK